MTPVSETTPPNALPATSPKVPPPPPISQTAWPWVLCLIGLDYFSTLGYQPSIAVEAAGSLAPLATVVVILALLFGVLPIYLYLAGRSPHGDGSFAVLERAIPGWHGKLLILVLLGFAATDFIFTKTLSAADAAVHITQNPLPGWQEAIEQVAGWDETARGWFPSAFWRRLVDYWDRQMVVTVLLLCLAFGFWQVMRRGFDRRVVQVSVVIVGFYLVMNALVIGSCLSWLADHPEFFREWIDSLARGRGSLSVAAWTGPGWLSVVLMSLLVFPGMALGLSGWEMSLAVMPLVKGHPGDTLAHPRGRIRHMRWLLITAAILVSLYLAGSVLVTTLLIPSDALIEGAPAHNRALAYLAHGELTTASSNQLKPLWFGPVFGLLYDLSTILTLCLAGASVTIVLRRLVPQFLLHFGMELEWAHRLGLIILGFNLLNVVVTVAFRASVSAQRSAYATSVLALITGAALAALLSTRKESPYHHCRRWYYLLLAAGFAGVGLAVALNRPGGILLAGAFMAILLPASVVSRLRRTTELRFQGFRYSDATSKFLWDSLRSVATPVLVPHRPGRRSLLKKEEEIRKRHHLPEKMDVVFLEVELGDASDFYQSPLMEIQQQEGRFVIRVSECVSVAHVIAAVALELAKVGPPPAVHFGWSDESTLAVNLHFVLFGQGNIPWLTRELVQRHERDPKARPKIMIG
jgi:hypothetical protein